MFRAGAFAAGTLPLLFALACGQQESPTAPNAQTAAPTETRLPWNVVVITLDTTRADALGTYGQSLPTSPGIDRMAEQGVLFEQAVTSSPSTLPSHSSIFTGKQPFAHGARSNGGYVLSEENVTLAEILKDAGYATGAEVAATVIAARSKLDQGFDHYRTPESPDVELKTIHIRGAEDFREVELPERTARDIARRGIEFIRANQRSPFFLWLHFFDVHSPYSAPAAFNRRIPESTYHAEVAYVDQQVELVLKEIERLGLRERTLVVLTADHGEGLHDHGEHTHTFFVYETTMHVPLIFWGPKSLLPGWRVGSLARTVDIVPTVLDLLDLETPGGVQGASLAPLLHGERDPIERRGYGESIEFVTTFDGSVLRFYREGHWKYVHKFRPSLYDLVSDPDESLDLAASEPERVTAMQARMRELLDDAPPPPAGAEQQLDAETRAELIALGYVGADAPTESDDVLAETELVPPDPVALTEDVALFAAARGRMGQEDFEEALVDFEKLWERNPTSAPVLVDMISCLEKLGRDERALELIPVAAELAPTRTEVFIDLAEIARRSGRIDRAIDAVRQAVQASPCAPGPRSTWAELLRDQGATAERIEVLETGVSECPDTSEFRNDLAWILATTSDEALRDGERAVALAEAAVAATNEPNVGYLDTLGAAYAERGDFDRAVEVLRRVMALLDESAAAEPLVAVFRSHLEEFQAGRPIREE